LGIITAANSNAAMVADFANRCTSPPPAVGPKLEGRSILAKSMSRFPRGTYYFRWFRFVSLFGGENKGVLVTVDSERLNSKTVTPSHVNLSKDRIRPIAKRLQGGKGGPELPPIDDDWLVGHPTDEGVDAHLEPWLLSL